MRNELIQLNQLLVELSDKATTKIDIVLDGRHSITGAWIPNIEDLFNSLSVKEQEKVHNVLVFRTSSGVVSLTLKMEVEKCDGTIEQSTVLVVIKPVSDHHQTALFRGPIRVTEHESQASVANICAAVFIQEYSDPKTKAINGIYHLLRLAEGPAHLSWVTNGSNSSRVSAKYKRPQPSANFIKNLVPNFVDAANGVTKSNPLGMGFLSMSLGGSMGDTSSSGSSASSGGKKKGKKKIIRKDEPELTCSKNAGVSIFKFAAPDSKSNGKKIKFESSYMPWTSGSPWSKVAISEFSMDLIPSKSSHPITFEKSGGKLLSASSNSFIIEVIDDSKFEVVISGFDTGIERIHRYTWEA
jgi:hypothetical protein